MLSDEIGYSRQDVIYDKAGGCMNKIYENEYPIRVIDTDLFRLCRPSSLMDFMQESAMEHTVDLGISSEDLIKVRAIWMLVRMKYTIHRPIRGGEVLRIKTWGRRPTGVFVMRDYELYVGQERVGEAVSTWVLGYREPFLVEGGRSAFAGGRFGTGSSIGEIGEDPDAEGYGRGGGAPDRL